MMKLLLAILLVISATPAFAQLDQTTNFADTYFNNMTQQRIDSNNIKQSITKKYDVKFGEIDKNGKVVEVNNYNELGLLVSRIQYTTPPDSSLATYSYNAAGDLAQMSIVYTAGKSHNDVKYIYKYDTCHNMIESREYDFDRPQPPCKMKYDDSDNRLEFVSYKEDGLTDYKIVYKYDKLNRCTDAQTFNTNGTSLNKKAYKYHPNGNIDVLFYTINASCSGCRKGYIVDSNNRLVREDTYGESGVTGDYIIYKYDDDGLLVEKDNFNKINELLGLTKFTYKKFSK